MSNINDSFQQLVIDIEQAIEELDDQITSLEAERASYKTKLSKLREAMSHDVPIRSEAGVMPEPQLVEPRKKTREEYREEKQRRRPRRRNGSDYEANLASLNLEDEPEIKQYMFRAMASGEKMSISDIIEKMVALGYQDAETNIYAAASRYSKSDSVPIKRVGRGSYRLELSK